MWQVSRAAVVLLFVTLSIGFFAGAVVGSWLLPVVVAIAHGGWSEVLAIPITEGVFADPPRFLMPGSFLYSLVDWGGILLVFAGVLVGIHTALKVWRHYAINKYGWLTAEQAEEFLKRDQGW